MPFSTIVDTRTNEILFDAAQVCFILGYIGNASDVLRKLDDDEKVLLKRSDYAKDAESVEGGAQFKNFVYESGLYKLIIRSNKPEAKAFTRWVTHEVLPTIRKTGGYTCGGPDIIAVNKLHKATYEMAIREGKDKVKARITACNTVKERMGVDIYELLKIEPPKASQTSSRARQAIRDAYQQNKEKFLKKEPGKSLQPSAGCWGYVDLLNGRLYFFPQALRDILTTAGLPAIHALSEIKKEGGLYSSEHGKNTTAVRIGSRLRKMSSLNLEDFLS